MKLSEFVEAYEDYKSGWIYSDLNSEVSFGCDCGCGGDSYTEENWRQMCDDALKAKREFERWCWDNSIIFDLDDPV